LVIFVPLSMARMKIFWGFWLVCLCSQGMLGQTQWQQHVSYQIEVEMDVMRYQYHGHSRIDYHNASPDTLRHLYVHLYPNAFQPGSEMDQRLQQWPDPDGRMVYPDKNVEGKEIKKSKIARLTPDEQGQLHLAKVWQKGKELTINEQGTIAEITLVEPLLPGQHTQLEWDFNGQVPQQIRRSGRNNKEGVALSMTQWYPKICEFDVEGWHANPYLGREFHGVWADFEVKITIDETYILGGTGQLVNAQQIGYGYEKAGVRVQRKARNGRLTWHFKAQNVHDFAWAADPDYQHDVVEGPRGVTLHFLYKKNPEIESVWRQVQPRTAAIMDFYNQHVGPYPYPQYSVIQGGDGGMEYAMCTLILGKGKLEGLTGLIAHEMGHSWFQQLLASNEAKHPWMDEGFTSFIEDWAMHDLFYPQATSPFEGAYTSCVAWMTSGKAEPLGTHADHYAENRNYSIASYSKGEVFLAQLQYILGKDIFEKGLQRLYRDFVFKHPTPNDVKRSFERVSGAHLDQYLLDWTQTNAYIDYGITWDANLNRWVIQRIGNMGMPLELKVTLANGQTHWVYVPLRGLFFTKTQPTYANDWILLANCPWTQTQYPLSLPWPTTQITSIEIDPTHGMADVQPNNNLWKKP